MGFLKVTKRRLGIAGELFSFFSKGQRWWVLPVLVVLGVSAVLIILAQSSAIAPFIYTLF
jgi:Family of unknown function (DUF5989)